MIGDFTLKQRSYYFDNGKFFLIVLVVLGHLITSYQTDITINALYSTIYTFHMPAFILISGYFAKGFFDKEYIQKLAKKLLLPYVIFQIIYTIFYYYLLKQDTFVIDLFTPQWSLWYLLSLFSMFLLLPLFTKMKKGLSLLIAVAISLIVGYVDVIGDFLSLSRTFVYFPYFLLGYYLKKEHFIKLSSRKNVIPAILMMIGTFAFFYFYRSFDHLWLFGSDSYANMDTILSLAFLQRLLVYMVGVLMVFSLFALIPKKQYWFTNLGKYTLYVYLLHGFVIKTFRASSFEQWISEYQLFWLLAPAAFVLVYFLSSHAVRTVTRPLIETSLPKQGKQGEGSRVFPFSTDFGK
jgi:fucose 4-O-acetylase-like acetyltransferase